jgi:hypothetical protein
MFTKVQFIIVIIISILCLQGVGNAVNLVVNPGFETAESTSGGPPGSYGDWNGDYSAIVGATSGITPMDGGSYMLQFKGTSHSGSGSGVASEMFQIIDISSYQTLIASGNAEAAASAYFNRVAGDAQTDTAFNIVLMAYDGSPDTFPSRWESSTYSSALAYKDAGGISTDSLADTWQGLDITLNLPAATTFIVIDLYAAEDVHNDIPYPEFDGHFADNVSVQIIPEPATICLFTIAGLLLRNKK